MEIKLTIDNQEVTAEQGKTLLDIAREIGADVPTICYHDATTANGQDQDRDTPHRHRAKAARRNDWNPIRVTPWGQRSQTRPHNRPDT